MKINQPFGFNEQGIRENSEDSVYPAIGKATPADRTFLVCDGMGGHESGEVASSTVCEAISDYLVKKSGEPFTLQTMSEALNAAYDALAARDHSTSEKRMGTTLTFLHLSDQEAVVAHIGDSRVYQVRPNPDGASAGIVHATADHSLVNDLVRAGVITQEEAVHHPKKNVITRAMQAGRERLDGATVYQTNDVKAGDVFFLCTDGVTEVLSPDLLCRIVCLPGMTDEQRVERIKQLCTQSHDNFSAYYVRISEGIETTDVYSRISEVSVRQPERPKPVMTAPHQAEAEGAAMATKTVPIARPVLGNKKVQTKSNRNFIIGLILVLLAGAAAIYGYMHFSSDDKTGTTTTDVNRDRSATSSQKGALRPVEKDKDADDGGVPAAGFEAMDDGIIENILDREDGGQGGAQPLTRPDTQQPTNNPQGGKRSNNTGAHRNNPPESTTNSTGTSQSESTPTQKPEETSETEASAVASEAFGKAKINPPKNQRPILRKESGKIGTSPTPPDGSSAEGSKK